MNDEQTTTPIDADIFVPATKQPDKPVKSAEPEDPAEALIKRIERIVKNTGCRHAVAAWAIAMTERRLGDQPLPYPRLELVRKEYLPLEGPLVQQRST